MQDMNPVTERDDTEKSESVELEPVHLAVASDKTRGSFVGVTGDTLGAYQFGL